MKTVLCFSGGMDSTTLLAQLIDQGHEVICLSVDYGQRHARELEAASLIHKHYKVELVLADLCDIRHLFKGSSQTSLEIPVPEGHYADENMKKTVVPNRNMVLLSLAGALAVSRQAGAVAYAAHLGDHTIYPDCRPEFVQAMKESFRLCDFQPIDLLTPFLDANMSKTDIAKRGAYLKVPFSLTWSCYNGGLYHCGKCGTCVERKEAFRDSNVPDPTTYLSDRKEE